MGNTIVKRTTLIVRDIKKSRAWYEQVLEMSAYYDDEVVLSGTEWAAEKKGDKTHLVILKCQDPVIGMIGLLQWIDPVWPAPEKSHLQLNMECQHLWLTATIAWHCMKEQ